MASEEMQDAVIRNIEVIGEAAKRVSAEARGHLNQLEWKAICGMCDVLIHDYIGVDLDEVGTSFHPECLNCRRYWSSSWRAKAKGWHRPHDIFITSDSCGGTRGGFRQRPRSSFHSTVLEAMLSVHYVCQNRVDPAQMPRPFGFQPSEHFILDTKRYECGLRTQPVRNHFG